MESKKQNKWTNKKNNRIIGTKNIWMISRGNESGGEERNRWRRLRTYKLPVARQMNHAYEMYGVRDIFSNHAISLYGDIS